MNDKRGSSIAIKAGGAALAILLAAAGWFFWRTAEQEPQDADSDGPPRAALPWPREDSQFITSQGCSECHPDQYASWHASYHRTMTQPLTAETVKADFDDVSLELRGHEYRLNREGDKFWVELPELDYSNLSKPPTGRIKRQLVMSTGSHHLQAFWMATGSGNFLRSLPFMYQLADQRWLPVEDSVLEPPGSFGENTNTWNNGCSRCHSVAAIPNVDPAVTTAQTRVAELGIACEACHGAGEKHAQSHRGVVAAASTPSGQADPTIIQPATCDHRVSAQICGQCHSLFTYTGTRNHDLAFGHTYRAGDELTLDRVIVQPLDRVSDPAAREICTEFFHDQRGGVRSEFYDDGTPRITGREYNGLLESACFLRGKLSCVSCHSMHESDPNDQLAAKMQTNEACYQCHGEYRGRIEQHTHHQADSSGSACYNCHMPNTTFGLMAFSRSHRIDSPSAADSHSGRPNACVLCHLDQTLSWSAKHLSSWYGQAEPPLDEVQNNVAAAVLYGLRGDPCQRALIAWHARWEPARAVSGSAWLAPLITPLLVDPYSAVRYQAAKTLKTLPGFEKLPYDFIAPEEIRAMRQQQAVQLWEQHGAAATDRRGPQVLLDPDGKLMHDRFRRLLEQRDNRPLQCIN